jgi:hypothetical protein
MNGRMYIKMNHLTGVYDCIILNWFGMKTRYKLCVNTVTPVGATKTEI